MKPATRTLMFTALAILALIVGSDAQILVTTTFIEPGSGATVVEVLSENPIAGITGTAVYSTLLSTSASTSPLSTSTTPLPTSTSTSVSRVSSSSQPITTTTEDDQGGPVGVTTASNTGPAPPTTYVYTTTDGNGVKTVVTAVFTPTYQATSPYTTPTGGTILAYSDFTKMFSQPAGNTASPVTGLSHLLVGLGLSTLLAVLAGVML